jgi:hypothetical protein
VSLNRLTWCERPLAPTDRKADDEAAAYCNLRVESVCIKIPSSFWYTRFAMLCSCLVSVPCVLASFKIMRQPDVQEEEVFEGPMTIWRTPWTRTMLAQIFWSLHVFLLRHLPFGMSDIKPWAFWMDFFFSSKSQTSRSRSMTEHQPCHKCNLRPNSVWSADKLPKSSTL